jgi:hypothetical protein
MPRSATGWALLGAWAALTAPASWGQGKAAETYPYREIRGPTGHIEHVAFSPDGALMAGGAGAVVVLWNVADGKEVQRLQLPDKQIYHRLAFAADGKTVIWNGREDPMVRVFDVKTGKQVREFRQPHGPQRGAFSSYFLAYSPDGRRMAFRGATVQGVDVLDVATGRVVVQLKEPEWCGACAFSADGRRIATSTGTGGVRVWDGATGKLQRELQKDQRGGGGHTLAAFSPDGQFLATGGYPEGPLDVWDLRAGKRACALTSPAFFRTASFSADNLTLLYVAAGTERAVLHHLVAEKEIYRFDPPHRLPHFAAFTPDRQRVAVIGPSSEDGSSGVAGQLSVYLYDLPAGALSPSATAVDDAALEKLLAELSSDNELRLQLVRKAFRAAPRQAVEVIGKKVRPVSSDLRRKVEKTAADLDDDAFTRREQAMRDLQGLAHRFAPLLEAKRRQAPAGEGRNRLSFVLKQMGEEKTPASLQVELRAVRLLEEIGTAEARDLLDRLARGAAQARLTVEARAALDRLNSRPQPPPRPGR